MTALLPGYRTALPGIVAWLDHPWPFPEHNPVRIEESTKDGKYTVRAELPGFDPDQHIAVTAHGGLLTIAAYREERKNTGGHSEFRCGEFSRTVHIPAGAEVAKATAKYADGILEVSMPSAGRPHEKHVRVHLEKG